MSFLALLFEELTYHQYKSKRDTLKLMLTILLEPIIYHPRSTWWGLKGNLDKFKGKNTWGEMTRAGFNKPENKSI